MHLYKVPILSTLVLCTLCMCVSCFGQTNNDLTIDKAVQIALQNNSTLQLKYKEIGISYEGALKHCTFATEKDTIDLSLFQNFLDRLLSPIKERVTASEIVLLQNEILGKMIDVVARTKIAFHSLQISTTIFELREQIALSKALAYEAAILLRCACKSADFDLASKKMELERAKLAVTTAQHLMIHCKEEVNDLLGLFADNSNWRYTTELDFFSDAPLDMADIQRDALQNNLALQNRFQKIKQRAKELSIPISNCNYSENILIPMFNIEKIHPIKVKSEFAYLWKQFSAEAGNIQSIVSKATTNYHHCQRDYLHERDHHLPSLKKAFEESLLKNSTMDLGIFEILKAKESVLEEEIVCLEKQGQFYLQKVFIQALSMGQVLLEKFR